MNNAIKRNRVLSHLKKLKADNISSGDTPSNQDHSCLCRGWVGKVYHSNFQFKSRGAAILYSKTIPFICSHSFSDSQGRYVIVEGTLYNVPLVLICIYAPKYSDDQFFTSLWTLIPYLNSHCLIMQGDFSCVLNPRLHRYSKTTQPLLRSALSIESFLKDYGMVDPWRWNNPTTRCFSFFFPVHQSYSRIDYFLSFLTIPRTYCHF